MIDLKIDSDSITKSIEIWGITRQSHICAEELAELIQAVMKMLRSKQDKDNLIEEIADVYIILEILKEMHSIPNAEIQCVIDYKQRRTAEKMSKAMEATSPMDVT